MENIEAVINQVKPILNCSIETIISVDYNDLDDFVHEVLGFKKYEFVAVQECGNDSSHNFTINGNLSKYDLEQIDKWKAGNFVHYSNHTILSYLCKEKYINPGKYLIFVYW